MPNTSHPVSSVARTFLMTVALLTVILGTAVATAQASQAAVRPTLTSDLASLDGASVRVGEPVAVTGSVSTGLSKGPRRPVELQTRTGQTWKPLGQTQATKTGRFTISLPTNWYGTHQMRLVAPAGSRNGTVYTAVYGTEAQITITPDFTPAASTRFDLSSETRWNPCEPITWAYSTTGLTGSNGQQVTDQAYAALRWAFDEVARATGITFTETTTTASRAILDEIEGTDAAPANLIVGWGTSAEIAHALGEDYPGSNPSLTAPDAIRTLISGSQEGAGTDTYRAGGLLLNADRYDTRPALASRTDASWQATFINEIGRLLGLAAIRDEASVMNASGPTSAVLSTGDLNGFRAVGLAAGCAD